MTLSFPHVYGDLLKLQLEPRDENSTLRFHLTFGPSSQNRNGQAVQFDVSAGGAMGILNALQTLQARHGWPLPSYRRKGRPTLKIVETDDKT
jgi:hypothetical protein